MKNVLVLRCCSFDLIYNGFQWKSSGEVEAPDWDPEPKCGGGLHGWLWGEGDPSAANQQEYSKWLVVSVEESSIVDLHGKVKFPKGEVVFVGARDEATKYLYENGGDGKAILWGKVIVGDKRTATAGDGGKAIAGKYGKAIAGKYGKAIAGKYGTATVGYKGVATVGYKGTATAREEGKATAGDYGTATVGYRGTATAGYGGTATARYGGTATAGEEGKATAGDYGKLIISYWDGKRSRSLIGYVGEDGIEANKPYKIVDGKFTNC